MWNVEERFEQATLDALPSKGFQVSSTGGVMRVEKYGCGAEFRRTPAGRYQMTILPPSCTRASSRACGTRATRNS